MSRFVGIDLGTTYSVIACINAQGQPEIIRNDYGNTITPSVVYLGAGQTMGGDAAKERQAEGAQEVVSFFKRNMGNAGFILSFHGRDYTPTDLSTFVLAYLKKQAENYFGETVTDAVITVPAYFAHVERTATIEAGQRAGFNVLKLISEPTAAALAYGLRPSQRTQNVLVYDLGGGTFDISLVEITPTELTVKATDGDHNLGGKDWDERLIRYLSSQFEQEFGVELPGDDVNELRVQAEQLKFALSAKQSASVRVQAQGNVGTYTITREQFESLTDDLMERTRRLTEHVLEEGHLAWTELDGILPVGGSTRMPMVSAYIERMSGKAAMGGINKDEAVALGAAIQAAMELASTSGGSVPLLRGKKTTSDVIAHSLGLIAENTDRSRYVNSILIPKNKTIPSTETRPYRFLTRRNNTSELEVFLTQGESDDPQICSYLGCYAFSDFPSSVAGREVVLDVAYEYDKNGTVHVSAIETSTRQPLKLTIKPVPSDVPARFLNKPSDLQAQVSEHLTVYLAFDVSGSMSGSPIADAQKAAREFLSKCDLTTTSIGIISVSDRVHVDLNASQNSKDILRAIDNLRVGSTGGGNSGHPFDTIYDLYDDASGLRYAIVLADGVWSHQDRAIIQAKRCHAANIQIISIGFGSANKKFLADIASTSDMSIFTTQRGLTEVFSTIAREITGSGSKGIKGMRLQSL